MIEGSRDALKGFVSGSCVLEPYRAAAEASRCLGCGYRVVEPERCMGCGVCVTVCPSGAVTMRSIEPGMIPADELRPENGIPYEEQEDFASPSAPEDPQVQPLHEDAQSTETSREMRTPERCGETSREAAEAEELVPETVGPIPEASGEAGAGEIAEGEEKEADI